MLKKLSISLALLLLLILATPFVLPWVLDLNRFKDEIAQVAGDFSGYDISIEESLEVTSLLPTTIVSVAGLKVSAPGSLEPLASVEKLAVIARPFGLLTGEVIVETLSLDRPIVNAEIDERGLANWDAGHNRSRRPEPASGSDDAFDLPFDELRIENARLTSGFISYSNAVTGETHEAKDIDLLLSLPSWEAPLEGEGRLTLNAVPVFLNVLFDNPAAVLSGKPAKTRSRLESRHLTGKIDLTLSQAGNPVLNGDVSVEIPSAASFAQWLGQPLAAEKDPGRVTLSARLASEGSATTLEELRIEGDDWQVMANAKYDPSQEPRQIMLEVSGDRIDLDRYLPRNSSDSTFAENWEQDWEDDWDFSEVENSGEAASWLDAQLDLAFLRGNDLDFKLDFAGIKAGGFEVGKTALTAKVLDGVLDGYLRELTLYGGRILGDLHINTQETGISAETRLAIDKIDFSKMHLASGRDLGLRGTANGYAELSTRGTTPRALATALTGSMNIGLKGANGGATAKQVVTDTNLNLIIPEEGESPYLLAQTHFGGKRIDLDIESDPLSTILEGLPFALDIDLKSPLLTAKYEGTVHQSPVFSLDGGLDIDTPSAGKLASWLGKPLGSDPGPISLTGRFDSDGTVGRIAEARLKGAGLDAELSGDFDLSGDIKKYRLHAKSGRLDLRPFFPSESGGTGDKNERTLARTRPDQQWQLSDKPLDLTVLKSLDAEITIDGEGAILPQGEFGELHIKASAKGGKAQVVLERASLAKGTLQGEVRLDASGKAPVLSAKLRAADVQGEALSVLLFDGGSPQSAPLTGTLDANLDLTTGGESEKQLIASLQGRVDAKIGALRLADETFAENSHLSLKLAGQKQDPTAQYAAQLRFPGRETTEPFEGKGTISPLARLFANDPFSFDLNATLAETKVAAKGTVIEPLTNPAPEAQASVSGERYELLDSLLDAGLAYRGPFNASVSVRPTGDLLQISNLSATFGASSLSGELNVKNGVQPAQVTGYVTAPNIDLVELLGTTDSDVADIGETIDSLHKNAETDSRLFPDSELPFHLLDSLDADLQLNVASLQVDPTFKITDIDAHVTLQSGQLTLEPFSMVLWGGKLSGVMTANNSGPTPDAAIRASLAGVDYGAMLAEFDVTEGLHGLLDVEIDVKGQGPSLHALASSASGTLGWLGKEGQLDRKLLGMFAFGSGDVLAPLFGEKNNGELACSVFAMDFDRGIGSSRVQYYETSFFSMVGEGTIDLRNETINFSYSPSARSTSLMSLAVPFKVTGPLDDPGVSVGTEGTLVGAAKAAGAVISVLNPLIGAGLLALNEVSSRSSGCDNAIAMAKGEEIPPASADPAAKTINQEK